jgi:glutaconate CoA-transferase subunit B
MVITPQDSRRFVEQVDFITTPGYLLGPGSREEAGLPKNSGPHKVITDMAVMGYDPDSKRMRVESIHKGHTFKDVQENTGFELLKAPDVIETPEPTTKELTLLREEVDPNRYIIGR